MLIPLCIFLMASYFLPALTASHYLLINPIGCGEWTQEPHKPLTTADCSTLVMNLRLKEWTRELKPWGSSQPGEFKLHKLIAHATFEMEIEYADSHEEGRGTTDVFRLADYFEELMWVQSEHFPRFPPAWFGVGPQKLFDVYLGALIDYTLPPIEHRHAIILSATYNDPLSQKKKCHFMKACLTSSQQPWQDLMSGSSTRYTTSNEKVEHNPKVRFDDYKQHISRQYSVTRQISKIKELTLRCPAL